MPLVGDTSAAFASALAKGLVKSVTVRSQITPDYTYDPWAPVPEAPPGGGGSFLMDLVKPEITVETSAGPVAIAPYGAPTENYVPHVVFGGLAAVIGAFMLVVWIARATK